VTLSSRANFILLLPLAFAVIRRQTDSRTAVRAIALSCLSIACLTLPFYLHDPEHFAPLEGAGRLLVFDHLLPHLGTALIAAMAALAVGLSFTRMDAAALFETAHRSGVPVAAASCSTIRDGASTSHLHGKRILRLVCLHGVRSRRAPRRHRRG
jgi:hypothetical protein